jgi:ribonuclease Z
MTKLIFLGTSNAIPDQHHENTHLAVLGKRNKLLIDCGSNPIVRLQEANINVLEITDLILTHFHPDHVFGAPLLLMSSWLMGRQTPLNIYGLKYTLDRVKIMMDAFEWKTWPNFFPVAFHEVQETDMFPVFENNEFKVYSSPVHHIIPNIGLRIEFEESNQVLAYSCDTEPCDEVIKLAEKADILVHETAGDTRGHSSASQAGEIATKSNAKTLYLIHYPTDKVSLSTLTKEAQKTFSGHVYLAEDLQDLSLE